MTDATTPALERALRHARAHLETLDEQPVGARAELATLRERLDVAWTDAGVPAVQVVDELVAATAGGHHGSAGGRFFAWVIGGALPSALAADWLTSAWDNNSGLFACAPAASVTEEICGAWLKDLFDLPAEASFALTTGCQLAHVTALAAARHAVLRDAGWDVEQRGLFGAPPIRMIVNEDRHGSIDRAVRFLGFGRDSLRILPLDADGRLGAATLAEALAEGSGPAVVVLQAADLHLGACDDYETLIPLCKAAGAWVHVDGAFGLWAKASPRRAHLMRGVEAADSWATDGHKWLNVPYDSGIAFVRDRAAHRASMTLTASYLAAGGDARDPIDWTPEFSRRGRGFAIYAALRELGRSGLANLIDRCCDHAETLAHGIAALPGAVLIAGPGLNQAVVRFLDTRADATEADHDRRTDAIIAAVNAGGEAYFSGSTWRGKRAMRISVSNWRTDARDIARAVEAVRVALAG
jgi:glutamate/tyrosine decarboxylase-like PLP-dependent enzyme